MKQRVPDTAAGERLDRYLASLPEVGSRAAAERLLAAEDVRVDGEARAKSYRLSGGEDVEFELARTAVERVTCNREIDRREVDANLMRSPGLEPDVEQGVSRQQLHELEVRHRIARRVRVQRVTERISPVTPDRRLDATRARTRVPDDEREVVALELSPAHERLQTAVRLLGAGDDHQAGRVAVEAMDDSRPVIVAAGSVVRE